MKKLLTILFVLIAFVASAQSTFNRWFPTSGTDTYTTNITSYSAYANTVVYLKFGNTNTGAATININSIGAANIRYWDGNSWEPLPASHIDVNTVYKLSYNGSYFEMEAFGTGTGGGTTMNNLPVEYKVTNYSLVPGDTSKMLVLQSPFNTLTLGSFASGVDGSQFIVYNETGATVTINPSTYVTKGPLEILDTTYAYIHFNADTFRISTATAVGGTGTPGGADTQVQFNDGGAFNGEAEFTYNKTDNVVKIHKLAGDATDGLIIEASNGTDVGILGAGNTANATWYGSHNFDAATASTLASFGASKTLASITTGTGVITALGVNVGSAGAFVVNGGAGGTPSSLTLTNATGLPVAGGGTGVASLTAYAPIFGGTTSTGAVQSGTVGTAGQVLTSNGAGALPTFQTPSASASYWTTVPGTPTRTGNYTFTVTDAANANLYNRLLTRTTVLKWTDAGNTKMAMVVSATYAADVVTVTTVGDILNTGFTSMRYALEKADRITFAIAGSLATGTNLSRKHKAYTELKVFGADALHGTAGTTNATTYDINKNGTTIFATKISVASGFTVGNGYTADDGTTLTLDDVLTLDCDSVSTSVPVDAYIDLFVFPLYSQYLN